MKCNDQQQKVLRSGSHWLSLSAGRVVLRVAEFELFTFRPGPSFTRGEKVWTVQGCLIEFAQAVSWDGNVYELLLLQQCYNKLRLCLDGCHVPVVGSFFVTLWTRFGKFCGQKSAVCKFIELLSFFILLLHVTSQRNTDTDQLTSSVISEFMIGNR